MKTVETTVRTGGTEKMFGLLDTYSTKKVKQSVSSLEDFLSKNKPVKPSDNLLAAIEKAYNENGVVHFNCGNGNQSFYFSEIPA